jgi:predicted RNA-binding protein with PUA-like domain
MAYWLFKSEPDEYSISDLASENGQIGRWDGIRNYQARNFLRDSVAVGDQVLFYHSACKVPAVAGSAQVVRDAYPDPAQFDPHSKYFAAVIEQPVNPGRIYTAAVGVTRNCTGSVAAAVQDLLQSSCASSARSRRQGQAEPSVRGRPKCDHARNWDESAARTGP